MTKQEQNIAICKAIGRTYHKPTEAELASGSYHQYEPNFCNDLSGIGYATSKCAERDGFIFQERYVRELRTVVTRCRRDCNEMQIDYWMAEATSDQRSEALLRALNLWDY